MKKINSANIILLLGVILCFFSSFIIGNVILGLIIFLVSFGFVLYKQRASFMATSAASAYKKGEIEKSFGLYEKALAVKGCPDMAKIVYAYYLISEGQVSKCAKVLEALDCDLMNEQERLNYNATNALSIWKQGNIHRAIEIYEALLNEKDSILIYETLGYLLVDAKDYEKALAFNLKAVELYSTNERIKSNLATSYYYLGHEKEAVRIYKELIEDYANFPEPYYYYGLILEACKKYKGAVKYWKMALEKKSSYLYPLTGEDIQYKIDEIAKIQLI